MFQRRWFANSTNTCLRHFAVDRPPHYLYHDLTTFLVATRPGVSITIESFVRCYRIAPYVVVFQFLLANSEFHEPANFCLCLQATSHFLLRTVRARVKWPYTSCRTSFLRFSSEDPFSAAAVLVSELLCCEHPWYLCELTFYPCTPDSFSFVAFVFSNFICSSFTLDLHGTLVIGALSSLTEWLSHAASSGYITCSGSVNLAFFDSACLWSAGSLKCWRTSNRLAQDKRVTNQDPFSFRR